MNKKVKDKKKNNEKELSFIKGLISSNKISVGEISELSEIDHPLFNLYFKM
ncbi:MAG: hypothetical protein LRY34_02285 [Bacteroides graminisolvens]|nr:hypothetical protein [Bacteroides graminisolvens]